MRIRRNQGTLYRSRSQSFIIVLAVFAGDVFLASLLVRKAIEPWIVLLIAAFIIAQTALGLRTAFAAIFVSKDGIRVTNLFKTFRLPWADIELFDIGRSGFLPQVCRIHTKDGKVLRAIGIQESNASLLQPEDLRPAQKIATQLNQELATHANMGSGDRC